MPCSLRKRHKLDNAAATANQDMRGHLHATNFTKVRVRIPIEIVGKKRFDFRSAELARRQADAVNNDHRRLRTLRARITVRTVATCGLLEPAGGFVHSEEA